MDTYTCLRPLDDRVQAVCDATLSFERLRLRHEAHKLVHSRRQVRREDVDIKRQCLSHSRTFVSNRRQASTVHILTSTHSRSAIAAVRRTTSSEPGPLSCSRYSRTCHTFASFAG